MVLLGEGALGDQLSHGAFVDASAAQRRVEATPAATMRSFQAQMHRRGDGPGRQEGVGQFEQRVGAAIEAPVEGEAEAAQSIESSGAFHNGAFCSRRSSEATRCARFSPAQLKHKLSLRFNSAGR